MKNILAVLLVVLLLTFVYAVFQQAAAKKAQMVAEMNLVLAEKARKEADEMAVEARDAQLEAKRAEMSLSILKEELAKCKGKK